MTEFASCSGCGAEGTVDRFDITEDGYLCARCASDADDRRRAQLRADEMAYENKLRIAGSGFRFWNLVFRCTECGARLPDGPPLLSLAFPPNDGACERCGQPFSLGLFHRLKWMQSLLFKVGVVTAALVTASYAGESVGEWLLYTLAIAALSSVVLAVPATLVARLVRR